MSDLVTLPAQPDGVPWPTDAWPEGGPSAGSDLDATVDEAFGDEARDRLGNTLALLVVQGGRLVAERYGEWVPNELEQLAGRSRRPVEPDDRLLSWSMAKSVTHAALGIAIGDGALAVTDRAPVPAWAAPDDPRHAITWDDLLSMRPGLRWLEEYYALEPDGLPDVVTMLYGDGQADMAAFAAGFDLVHEPGSPEAYTYSSGTTNIVAAALQRTCGLDEQGMRTFLAERLFDPIGFRSADPRFDGVGTFIGSSYVYAVARDWARFGLLALRDGVWDERRILPAGWIDHGRTPRSPDDDVASHGAHWWSWVGALGALGTFGARGFEGQRILCVPARDAVVVRLGRTGPEQSAAMDAHLASVVDLLAPPP